jgi:hypothetical protein
MVGMYRTSVTLPSRNYGRYIDVEKRIWGQYKPSYPRLENPRLLCNINIKLDLEPRPTYDVVTPIMMHPGR